MNSPPGSYFVLTARSFERAALASALTLMHMQGGPARASVEVLHDKRFLCCLRGPTKYRSQRAMIHCQSFKGKPVARRGRKASGL
jgi:hypothetical protein